MHRILTHHRLRTFAASAFVFLLATATANAQDKSSNSTPIEAYLDMQTTVVGWVDLTQVDFDKLTDVAKTYKPYANSDMTQAKAVQSALVQLGVTRIYWISDLAGLTRGPQTVVVPSKAESIDAVTLILKTLAEAVGGTAVMDGTCVLVGDKDAIANLPERSGEADAEFLSTMNALPHPHALALKTPITALVPVMSVLPEIFGSDNPRVTRAAELLINVKSVTLSGLLPPSTFELQMNTTSRESAEGIASLINDWTTSEINTAAQPIHMQANDSRVVLVSTSMDATDAVIEGLQKLMLPARHRAQRRSTLNSLKQIALAMHNFHDVYGHFPPQSLANKDGQRLLSWRVLILPYLDNGNLYNKFHLAEPWDSPHNIKLVSEMPAAYRGSQADQAEIAAGKTRIVAPLTRNSVFGRPGSAIKIQNIVDGTSNTLMIVEAATDQALIWTRPVDVEIPSQHPLTMLLDAAAEGFHACMCDGSARLIPKTLNDETLQALLSTDGREIIDFDKL